MSNNNKYKNHLKICAECSIEFYTHKKLQVCCSKKCATTLRHKDPNDNVGFKSQGRLDKNPAWKGNAVSYRALHSWVVRNWGKPMKCENCGTTTAKMYDWSNKTGTVSRDRSNWQRFCRSCHQYYDHAHGMRGVNKYVSSLR